MLRLYLSHIGALRSYLSHLGALRLYLSHIGASDQCYTYVMHKCYMYMCGKEDK